ncbi:hypothetical protein HanXRQr2_Chr16g0749541 [Helianthus annuus]|uniref:Uncharacterized protein n=1 Tax=Helianthus annuus TaxID=4232 RepID=A0A9K3H0C2_HELAN|nr:hypothetical protein HanXRQr2_Chr16g0749541 [Helianthus annuus]
MKLEVGAASKAMEETTQVKSGWKMLFNMQQTKIKKLKPIENPNKLQTYE